MPNMEAIGADGALVSIQACLGWACGRIFGKGGTYSQALLEEWWGMGQGLVSA